MDSKPEVIDDRMIELHIQAEIAKDIVRRMLKRVLISKILLIPVFGLAIFLGVRFLIALATNFEILIGGWEAIPITIAVQLLLVGIIYLMRKRNEMDGEIVNRIADRALEEVERRVPSKN